MPVSFLAIVIGIALVNGVAHYALGVLNARIMSPFGYGRTANMIHGPLYFAVAIGLYA